MSMSASVDEVRQVQVDWREVAACRDAQPELFFPSGTGSSLRMQTDQAKAVCHGCPVVDRCLGFALASDETEGIWGGLTTQERRAARRALVSGRAFGTHRSNAHA